MHDYMHDHYPSSYGAHGLEHAAEHLHETLRCRSLFATHYHQLTALAEELDGVHNLNVAVREWDDEIVFLHRIEEGGTDRSYGIQVARLAGVPQSLIERAKAVLMNMERGNEGAAARTVQMVGGMVPPGGLQLGLFDGEPSILERTVEELDPDAMTPMEALLKLRELKGLLDS